jgi:hypothetical protein
MIVAAIIAFCVLVVILAIVLPRAARHLED